MLCLFTAETHKAVPGEADRHQEGHAAPTRPLHQAQGESNVVVGIKKDMLHLHDRSTKLKVSPM